MDKKQIIENLKKLKNFVKWDRFIEFYDEISFFGWIDREDSYKDFVLIRFYNSIPNYFATSSAKYSKKIAKILGFIHTDCKKVEDFYESEG
jgi:hypothetical protein